MAMPGRFNEKTGFNNYTFGFNGMEKDNEVGQGYYTTLYRPYDSRIGRWITVDPEEKKYPEVSPYCSMDNNPIEKNDENGDFWNYAVGALAGATVEYAGQVATSLYEGKNWSDALYN
jgi:RHS repeat-associated protein